MFALFQSNRMERLAAHVAQHLRAPMVRSDSATRADTISLAPEVVLVPSQGSAAWLKAALAEELGVVAHLQCQLPASFIWQLCELNAGITSTRSSAERNAYERDALTWRIQRLLSTVRDKAGAIAGYLDDDPRGTKQLQLAQEIASVFDQYLVYRPDWIAALEQGHTPTAFADLSWQVELWRDVVADIGHGGHRAHLMQTLLQRLRLRGASDVISTLKLPARLFVFATLSLPAAMWDVLSAMALHIDVVVLLTNPCEAYWSDLISARRQAQLALQFAERGAPSLEAQHYEVGHPLLSLARLSRESVDIATRAADEVAQTLQQAAEMDAEFIAAEAGGSQAPPNLLHSLQDDVLTLRWRQGNAKRQRVDSADRSLRVQICHNRLREVEALHDQLLRCFEEHPALRPKDIVVMVPDLPTYAPLIDAVFGAVRGPRAIPYVIADRISADESPLLLTVWRLFEFLHSRWQTSAFLELAKARAVGRRFGLNEESFSQLLSTLREAAIHWGNDDAHWRSEGMPGNDHVEYSWRSGLDRLLLTFATGPGQQLGEVRALDEFEAPDELLESFARMYRSLNGARLELGRPRPLASWSTQFGLWLNEFFALDDEDDEFDVRAFSLLRAEVARLVSVAELSGHEEPVSAAAVLTHLRQRLRAHGEIGSFLTGKVTFCTLLPMRSLPFEIVALIGMNDEDYPRRSVQVSFDAMVREPRAGDRRRSLEDRQLFFDAIASARQRLLISYVGRGDQDDAVRPPSVLVSDLLAALDHNYAAPDGAAIGHWLSDRHRLQPFFPEYYRPRSTLASFEPRWQPGRGAPAAPTHAIVAKDVLQVIPLDDLERFVRGPQLWYLRNVLGARVLRDFADESDDEPFSVVGLNRWQLQDSALAQVQRLNVAEFSQWLAGLKFSGRLTKGDLTDYLHELAVQVAAMQARRARFDPERWIDRELDVAVGNHRVRGQLGGSVDDKVVTIRVGRARQRDIAALWLKHLLLNADAATQSVLIDGESVQTLAPVVTSDALRRLDAIVGAYVSAHTAPPNLLVDTALVCAKEGEKEALKAWGDERQREEVKLLWVDDDPPPGFADVATAVYRGIDDVSSRSD